MSLDTVAPRSVDILIVSFNTRELLRRCLRSIAEHAPAEGSAQLQVSVFDNASADGSAAMVATEFPAVRLVCSTQNCGFGRATNALASTSEAEYLMLLNSDTEWPSDVLTPLLDYLEREPDVAVVAPRLVYPDGTLQLSSQQLPTLRYELASVLAGTRLGRLPGLWDASEVIRRTRQIDRVGESQPRDTEFAWATCWLLRRELVDRLGLFDERFALYDEDVDYCLRLRRARARVVYHPGIEIIHVGGASSSAESKEAAMRRARERYYRLSQGRGAALAYRITVMGCAHVKRATSAARRLVSSTSEQARATGS